MLAGLKVLDLSRLLPGPYATLVLADLGAQVDKLEDPTGGDYLRNMGPEFADVSAFFYALNRNKRSLALDLKRSEGAAAVRRLVRAYDVLVESFRPGVMEKLGLSYEMLSRENRRLVYCSISGYGQTGPDRLRSGHDVGYMARAGVLGYGGEKDGAPALPGGQVADVGGGSLFAVAGILAALYERERTGRGRFVDVSMTEGAAAFFHMQLGARLAAGAASVPLRRGSELLNGGAPCYGVYRAKDGRYLAVGALEPKFFQGFCEVIGRPDLAASGHDTGEQGARARAEIAQTIASRTCAEWVGLFRTVDACVEPVLEGSEIEEDPQHRARRLFVQVRDPQREMEVTHLRTPLAPPDFPLRPPPALGQHGREILAEGGFSEEEITALLR
jgi:alpha-methylacyl-CoA racemase